ncbi:MAG: hypothetical protein OXN79_12230 [bacterium]|nr:hypothetical protein [bacterium]
MRKFIVAAVIVLAATAVAAVTVTAVNGYFIVRGDGPATVEHRVYRGSGIDTITGERLSPGVWRATIASGMTSGAEGKGLFIGATIEDEKNRHCATVDSGSVTFLIGRGIGADCAAGPVTIKSGVGEWVLVLERLAKGR